MAKRRRRHRTGSIIVTRKLSGRGLGKVSNPGSFLGSFAPPLIGGALAGGAALILQHLAKPSAAGEQPSSAVLKAAEYAPYVGMAVGALGAVAMYTLVSPASGMMVAAGALGAGGTLAASDMLSSAPKTSGRRMFRGVGAVVPQLMPSGMGAIVMEPSVAGIDTRDPRGETVSLGNVNPGAFGTPGFNI